MQWTLHFNRKTEIYKDSFIGSKNVFVLCRTFYNQRSFHFRWKEEIIKFKSLFIQKIY